MKKKKSWIKEEKVKSFIATKQHTQDYTPPWWWQQRMRRPPIPQLSYQLFLHDHCGRSIISTLLLTWSSCIPTTLPNSRVKNKNTFLISHFNYFTLFIFLSVWIFLFELWLGGYFFFKWEYLDAFKKYFNLGSLSTDVIEESITSFIGRKEKRMKRWRRKKENWIRYSFGVKEDFGLRGGFCVGVAVVRLLWAVAFDIFAKDIVATLYIYSTDNRERERESELILLCNLFCLLGSL